MSVGTLSAKNGRATRTQRLRYSAWVARSALQCAAIGLGANPAGIGPSPHAPTTSSARQVGVKSWAASPVAGGDGVGAGDGSAGRATGALASAGGGGNGRTSLVGASLVGGCLESLAQPASTTTANTTSNHRRMTRGLCNERGCEAIYGPTRSIVPNRRPRATIKDVLVA